MSCRVGLGLVKSTEPVHGHERVPVWNSTEAVRIAAAAGAVQRGCCKASHAQRFVGAALCGRDERSVASGYGPAATNPELGLQRQRRLPSVAAMLSPDGSIHSAASGRSLRLTSVISQLETLQEDVSTSARHGMAAGGAHDTRHGPSHDAAGHAGGAAQSGTLAERL
eukprot:357392-Chlamydomonas_euryale.AAC.23